MPHFVPLILSLASLESQLTLSIQRNVLFLSKHPFFEKQITQVVIKQPVLMVLPEYSNTLKPPEYENMWQSLPNQKMKEVNSSVKVDMYHFPLFIALFVLYCLHLAVPDYLKT